MYNTIEGFEPILCFAINQHQTPEEVFEMLQHRMVTMLGYEYYRNGISLINWKPDHDATLEEMELIVNWYETDPAFKVEDFDRLGECVNLSIADVLGQPRIEPSDRRAIEKSFMGNDNDDPDFIDPVVTFVVLSALEKIDELAEQKINNLNNK
jgi:hypothetical protein